MADIWYKDSGEAVAVPLSKTVPNPLTGYTGKYRMEDIPKEYGVWYLWYEDRDDGEGRATSVWLVLRELNGLSEFLKELDDAQKAYDWAMSNYRTADLARIEDR